MDFNAWLSSLSGWFESIKFSDNINGIGWIQILKVVLVFVVCKFVLKIVRKALKRTSKKVDPMLAPLFSSVCTYLVYIIATFIILDILKINTNGLIALFGAAGIAIGLSLKDTLGNIAAGIMILFLRPFQHGDYVSAGPVEGSIESINLFCTTLKTPDGLYVSAPNGNIFQNPLTNFTRNGTRRLTVKVGISYNDSLNRGLEVLNKIIEREERFLKTPAPEVMVESMGDSCVNIQLRAWTTIADYWNVYWKLNKEVKEEIERAGLNIPFPQRDVHMISS